MWAILLLGILAVVAFLAELPWNLLLDVMEDRKNRNDRGKGKRPSEKYVTR
jgi:hypothetical protein